MPYNHTPSSSRIDLAKQYLYETMAQAINDAGDQGVDLISVLGTLELLKTEMIRAARASTAEGSLETDSQHRSSLILSSPPNRS